MEPIGTKRSGNEQACDPSVSAFVREVSDTRTQCPPNIQPASTVDAQRLLFALGGGGKNGNAPPPPDELLSPESRLEEAEEDLLRPGIAIEKVCPSFNV